MERCPHCCRPCLFPNVNAARRTEEQEALQQRYDLAYDAAKTGGNASKLHEYEAAIAGSEAVISRSFSELLRLSYSEDEVFATFYQRVDAGLRLAGGDNWDRKRSIADNILFGDQNKRQVRFGSLTLDGHGLPHYGECSLLLREEMISHRATVFEENSVMFIHNHKVSGTNEFHIPPGYRAGWLDRGKLAAAKIQGKSAALDPGKFPTVLSRPGKDEKRDVFIEVHIWGSLTIRSFQQVNIRAWKVVPPSDAEILVVKEKLTSYNINFTFP